MKKKLLHNPIKERVLLTISDNSCDYIPKVSNAGKIINGYQIMHNGLKIIAESYNGEWMGEIIKNLKGHHEPQEEKAFYEILKDLKDGSSMLELGSNWSYYSMWFAKEIKNSINLMLEPDQEKLQKGLKHFKMNNLNSFAFIQGTVGKNFEHAKDFLGTTLVQYTVDYILNFYKIKKLSILHSDIQGAELNMLRGAKNSLKNKSIEYLFISTHHDAIHLLCKEFLKEMGYYIICEHSLNESSSADGLIVASSNKRDQINIFKVKSSSASLVKKTKNLIRYYQYKFFSIE
ncbi:Hypothetical protein P9515_13901 [Prochlorococcus marinus str. MIT 9515]|uniref:Methyltransferase FkbM domain-containing protein n=1 Tax=Prochlorococcus marinus (strain MIT 9515) TaxID=167542 RepID=A2BXT6_PROM5|nr:FkbM family methyltransferase [Prochlorococcus marinus]ABM72597.1 Hypothetical protein P9515_13901 [Prochlorococcus marinus str. MIT 9515]